jgi:drug/metabolite transporter (DMT)-like permease
LSLTFSERERVNVPIWAGVGAILIGGVLLVWRR